MGGEGWDTAHLLTIDCQGRNHPRSILSLMDTPERREEWEWEMGFLQHLPPSCSIYPPGQIMGIGFPKGARGLFNMHVAERTLPKMLPPDFSKPVLFMFDSRMQDAY